MSSWPLAGVARGATSITYVQGSAADPQTPQSVVSVTFNSAQVAGDLNVVAVGWNDSAATVVAVGDTKGNTYTRAVGPTVITGVEAQSIYYANNIAAATAGSNSVTVTFSGAATYPDIRILEYSGVDLANPVDVTAAASGSSATSASAAVTTTNAADLLFGANLVQTVTTGPGAGFTSRLLTTPDGDIAEDRMVATIGSYSATAPVSPAGQWIMQLVAFRAASGDTTPPTAPSGLTATATGNQIDLSWIAATDNVGVTGYLVERCQGPSCTTFTQLATPSGTTYSDLGLAPGAYSYRVRATDAAGNLGPYSNVASGTIPDLTPPTAPSGLSASPSGSQIALGWTAASDNVGVTGYLVERCTGAGCTTFAQLAAPSGTTYTDTGLAVDSYSYRVRATDAAGNLGPYSNVATASIPDTTPPTAPSGLTATATGTQIDLSWIAATDNVGVTGYRLERCAGASCGAFAQIASPTAMTSSDLALAPGTYSYRVRATDAAGNLGPYSNVATASIPDTTPPTAPSGLSAAPSGTQIALNWTGATDNVGVTGYLVERCQGPSCTTFAQLATPSGTTYNDTGLAVDSYSYRVRATDAAGNLGPYSNVANAAISDATPPTAPTTLVATVTGSQIDLSWTAATDNVGVTGYRLERCTGAGCGAFAQIATPAATTYSDLGLAPGSYSYRVRATDAAGNLGPYSNVATAAIADTTPPTAPGGLSAAPSGTQIALGWTAASDNVAVTGYLVERCAGSGCSTFAQIATPTGTTYTDTGLAIATYSYRVRATDAAGNLGPYSNVASATIIGPAAGLAVAYAFDEGLGTTTADASGNGVTGTLNSTTWTTAGKNANALSFYGSSSFVELGAPASLTSTGSMTWEAWVFATGTPGDDGQIIALSNDTTGWQLKTTPDTGPRTFGVAISADTTTHTQRYSKTVIALNTWYHVAGVFNAGVQTLDIFVNGVLDDGTLKNPTSSRTGIPATQVIPTGINANIGRRSGGFYFIGTIDDVRVYDRALSQTEIQADMSTPVGAPADTQPPTAPSNLSATPLSATQNGLSWSAATDNVGVTGYLIERCQGAGCTTFAQIATATATRFTDAGLTPNTSYTYQVRARDAAGNLGPYSNTASATTQAVQPPTAPTNLAAAAITASRIDLSWTGATSNLGITSYIVQRCQGAGCASFATIASTTGTTLSDTGLLSSTSYSYQVAAIDTASNTGPFSSIATATTLGPQPPTAPTNLSAAPTGATQISLSWTASTSSVGLATYVVQRCAGSGCLSFASIASPVTTSYADSGLTTGSSYSYRVQAVDAAGNSSPFSDVATATPLTGLSLAFGFNEGSGASVGDSSGNGILGAIQGATWTTSGKYGTALSFNGTSSFVDVGTPAPLSSTGSMTWEAWVFATGTPGDDGQIVAFSDTTSGWQLKTTPDTGP
jgi:fibronectin type 3 domain-containing protein